MARNTFIAIIAAMFIVPAAAQDSPLALQNAFVAAVEAEDVEAVAAFYASDAVSFPMAGPMRVVGPDGVRGDWGPFLADNEVIALVLHDQGHAEAGDLGVTWGLFEMTHRPKTGGEQMVTRGRYMDLAKRIGDRWYYIVDHASLPLAPPPK